MSVHEEVELKLRSASTKPPCGANGMVMLVERLSMDVRPSGPTGVVERISSKSFVAARATSGSPTLVTGASPSAKDVKLVLSPCPDGKVTR